MGMNMYVMKVQEIKKEYYIPGEKGEDQERLFGDYGNEKGERRA